MKDNYSSSRPDYTTQADRRREIAIQMAEYERRHGPVKTLPIRRVKPIKCRNCGGAIPLRQKQSKYRNGGYCSGKCARTVFANSKMNGII